MNPASFAEKEWSEIFFLAGFARNWDLDLDVGFLLGRDDLFDCLVD
jgi:hypothetical protein